MLCFRSKRSSGDKGVPTNNNPVYGQTQTMDEGMYMSVDDNPAYGERKLKEQRDNNEYELCDISSPSTQEPPTKINPISGQAQRMERVDEGMYVSVDDNPACGERKLKEQEDNDKYELCDIPSPSVLESIYDN